MKRDQRGQALLESILLGLLLIAALLWALGVLADLHRGALAASAAAREAGFDAARSASASGANVAVDAAVRRAFADEDLDPDALGCAGAASDRVEAERSWSGSRIR